MTDVACTIRGLAKQFGGLRVFRGVDLDVRRGQVTGLIGPNGAGKSTLIDCVSGFQRPDAGVVSLDGKPITGRSPERLCRAGLARTFQHPRVMADQPVLTNVLVGAHARGGARIAGAAWRSRAIRREERDLHAAALAALERVGCEALADLPAAALSTGQQRLVAVARALASDPRIVLLDEPAAGLSREESDRLAAALAKLTDEGLTVMVVEHDLSFVMSLCDRVAVLAGGELIADGPPAEVSAEERVIEAYIGVAA